MKRFYGVIYPTKKKALVKAFGQYFKELEDEYGDINIYLNFTKKGWDKELTIYPKGSHSMVARIELCFTYENNGHTRYQRINRKKVISEIEIPMFRKDETSYVK